VTGGGIFFAARTPDFSPRAAFCERYEV